MLGAVSCRTWHITQPYDSLKRCLHFVSEPSLSKVLRGWHLVVTDCTLRDLSPLSDKLPALSKLAYVVNATRDHNTLRSRGRKICLMNCCGAFLQRELRDLPGNKELLHGPGRPLIVQSTAKATVLACKHSPSYTFLLKSFPVMSN
jgi:hypothetical protein